VKDFKKSVGTLNGFCDLGEGDVDFKAVRRALRSVRYNGYITAEIPPYDPVRLKKTAETMKDLFG
jgi:hexulose-6-phosphate isomerase